MLKKEENFSNKGIKCYLELRNDKKCEKKKEKKKNKFNVLLNSFLSLLLKSKIFNKLLKKDCNNLILKSYKIETDKNLLKDYKILFLSDLHLEIIDNFKEIKLLLESKKYDYIIFGGDFYDNDESILKNKDKMDSIIKLFKEKSDNIISVLGNHDGLNVSHYLEEKTNLLINESIQTEDFSIHGVEDYVTFKETKDSLEINKDSFNLIISHTPDFVEKIEKKYDLMLSGHTHGGQVNIFGFAPINNCIDSKLIYGKWKFKETVGITTSGVGCSGVPVRIGIKPEIVDIEIKRKA